MKIINEPFAPKKKKVNYPFIIFWSIYGYWITFWVVLPAWRKFGA